MPHIGRIRLDGTHNRPHWLETAEEAVRVCSDGDHIFWASGHDEEAGTVIIGRANVDGTGLDDSWVTLDGLAHVFFAMELVTDGTYVYVMVTELDAEGGNAERAFIARIKVADGSLELEWHTASIDGFYQHLTVGGGHLYWTREINVSESWVARMKSDGTDLEPEWIKVPAGFYPPLTADANFLWSRVGNTLWVADLGEPTPTFEEFGPEGELLEASGRLTTSHVYLGQFQEGPPSGPPTGISEEGYLYYCLTEFEVEEEEKEERPIVSSRFVRLKRSDGTVEGHFDLASAVGSYDVAEFPFEIGEPGGEDEEEEPTNVVKVKAGGELIDGRRYVKAGGELVPT